MSTYVSGVEEHVQTAARPLGMLKYCHLQLRSAGDLNQMNYNQQSWVGDDHAFN